MLRINATNRLWLPHDAVEDVLLQVGEMVQRTYAMEGDFMFDISREVGNFLYGYTEGVDPEPSESDITEWLDKISPQRDPAGEQYWPNIVVVLWMIGDEQAVEPLISFVQSFIQPSGQATVSSVHYSAKTSALMSLGYVINKTGNQRALNYLRESVRPETWAARFAAGIAPSRPAWPNATMTSARMRSWAWRCPAVQKRRRSCAPCSSRQGRTLCDEKSIDPNAASEEIVREVKCPQWDAKQRQGK